MPTSDTAASDITLFGIWLYSIPIVFFISFLIMWILFIRMTFNSDNKLGWKKFWNSAEIFWLIVAGLSIFSAIPTSWAIAQDTYARALVSMSEDELHNAQTIAGDLYSSQCPREGGEFICEQLRSIALLDNPAEFEEIYRAFSGFMDASSNLDEGDPIEEFDGEILFHLNSAWSLSQDAAYERSVIFPSSDFHIWLGFFWPHLLSVGLSVRLSRAIAAFAF